ncbi:MAG: potassium transporter TrkA [Thermoplasmata archaeon]|nr:MAG: potassium transporter TrkA [Thermoplasmata archaeon]RLF70190.1 MAG: potassium transporter TrkA [Thermoplasmata archaeon]RLF74021.1 MAG: potassium transporter TrkA [Thermoplasmata archaeon]
MMENKDKEIFGGERVSIREALVEMKSLSEKIIDLAYAAIIFDSDDLANEVENIEEKLDRLLYRVRLTALMAGRDPQLAEQLLGILQVASAAEQIGDAAVSISRLLSTNVEYRPFIPFILKGGDEIIRALMVDESSDLVNRSIGDLEVEGETGARIIAIKRGNRWIFNVSDDTVIKPGDTLIVRGVEGGVEDLEAYCKGERRWGQ